MESETIAFRLHSCPSYPARRPVGVRLPTRRQTIACASRRRYNGSDYGGGLVDENMIVLRKRMHEMKMAERNYEPPADWMEWEKRYYTSYDAHVCEAVGLLQTLLMNTRPSLAIGMLLLLAFSLPTSGFVIANCLMDASRSVLSGLI